MKVYDVPQGSNDWHQARLGLVTASKVHVLFTPKGKQTANATRRRYALELAIERITKRPTFVPQSFSMAEGTEKEPLARIWYYLETKRKVAELAAVKAAQAPAVSKK